MKETEKRSQGFLTPEVKALMDAVPAIVWVAHDPQCRVITGNRAADEFLRIGRQQNISMSAPEGKAPTHFRVLKDGRELAPEELPVQRAARGIPVHDFEHEVVFSDGTSRTLIGNATPILDAQGRPCGAIAAFIDVTSQRAHAREIERQKRLFQNLTERLPNVITRVGPDGRYLYVSPALSLLTGRPAEYFIGKTLEEAGWPPEMCEKLRLGREHVFRTKKPHAVEFEFQTPKGLGRYQHTIVPEFSPDGSIESLLTVAFDLTPQMQIEQSLKASAAELERQKRMFQSLTEHLPHVVARLSTGGRILYVSPVVEGVIGMPPKQLVGKTPAEAGLPADFCQIVQEKVAECVRTKAHVFAETKFPTINGPRDFSNIGVPEFAADGSVESVLTVSMDVSAQKEAERAIKESASLLRRGQKIANMGSYELDLTTGEGKFSDQMCSIFGVETNSLTADLIMERIPAEEHARVTQAFEDMLATGSPFRAEHSVLWPDGRVRYMLSQGEIVARDANGNPMRVLGTVLDITERRHAEEELSKAQKLESLGLMAGGIAHDFNNLLTAIFGNVFLARLHAEEGGARNADIIEALNQAESAFKRAQELAQQILTFSKGGAPLRKTVALAPLIQDSVKFMVRGSSMRAEFLIDPALWNANVDEGQIGQAINNVVINAMQAGATLLKVDARNVSLATDEVHGLPAGRFLRLSLEDNGCGIPEEYIVKLFDPYFTTKPGGTGLGLPTTYSIVRRHDGNVTVDSVSGKGTRFAIYLPASDEPLSPVANEQHPVAARKGRPGRVLLMDDEAPVREVGHALLRKLGYEVELARDGEEALQLFQAAAQRSAPFSLAILDLTVPGGMGGKECLERLRALDPHIKALVSSGYFNDPVMSQHEHYGFQGRVPKPYRLTDLSRALAEIEEQMNPAVNG